MHEPAPFVMLRAADGATAMIQHDGAHVTSWRPAPDGEERLFLSTRTELREGVAIRGGIPVIFPQFAAEGPLPRHGFARTMRWAVEHVGDIPDGGAVAHFGLRDSPATRAVWPPPFEACLTVIVMASSMIVELDIINTGDDVIRFAAALHSYLRVSDIGGVALEGLRGHRYRESRTPGVLTLDTEPAVQVADEIDRVYVGAPDALLLRDGDRRLGITTGGFPDVVVWNPGAAKAAALPDMEPGGHRRMLCVEAAAVQEPVVLEPGASWNAWQELTVLS